MKLFKFLESIFGSASCGISPRPVSSSEKNYRGRLVPLKGGNYYVQIWENEKFTLIDITSDIESGKQRIKDYFEDEKLKEREIVYVY